MINAWVRERFALTALEYPIPARSNRLDFMLGALTLVALTLLVVTVIVLTQFYDPAPLGAHESVRYAIAAEPQRRHFQTPLSQFALLLVVSLGLHHHLDCCA